MFLRWKQFLSSLVEPGSHLVTCEKHLSLAFSGSYKTRLFRTKMLFILRKQEKDFETAKNLSAPR
jgi:hypothetical protein